MNTPNGGNALEDFQACQRHYMYGYQLIHPEELKKKALDPSYDPSRGIESTTKAYPLAIGTAFHAACEKYEETSDPDDMFRGFEAAWEGEKARFPNLEDYDEDALILGRKIVLAYLTEFRGSTLEQVATEKEFELPLVDPTDGTTWLYSGKIDRIVRFSGVMCVLERKSTSSTPAQFFPHFTLDRKMTGYIWASRILYPEYKPSAFVLEVLGKPKGKTGDGWARRELFMRSEAQIREWIDETCSILRAIRRASNGEEPWLRSTAWCENWSGYHKPCRYKHLCMAGPGANVTEMIEAGYLPKKWKEEEASGE